MAGRDAIRYKGAMTDAGRAGQTQRVMPTRAEVVVVGAGFAGLATAYELAARGVDVVVLEAEAIPGFHASGRNAAIARRLIEEPAVARLAVRGLERLRGLASEVPLFKQTGGLLLGDERLIARLHQVARETPVIADEVARMNPDEARALVPALAGADFEAALFLPGDGVVDIHALLSTLAGPLRGKVFYQTAVTGIRIDAGPRPTAKAGRRVGAVETDRGTIECRVLVDAAGFQANRVAALAGLGPLPFRPVRRHLFVTAPTDRVAATAPWVWEGTTRPGVGGWYFRPEGAGLLMCACDQTAWGEADPSDPPVDPGAREALADKFFRALPELREVRPARGWAGLRILTPDDRFVIGPDPRLEGFVWVAGLGGHGMTTACGVGELGAMAACDEALPAPYREAFDPARFLA